MNKNVEFAERTGTSVESGIARTELFAYCSKLHKKLEEEAVTELWDGLVAKDIEQILDSFNDTVVYLDQWRDSLIKAGIDVNGAQEAVALNNELKYTTYKPLAYRWLYEHIERGSLGYFVESNTIDDVEYYCVKNQDNKVVKPVGHPKVDLKEFIPAHLLEVKQYEWDSTVGTTDFDQLLDETSDS